MCIVSACLRVEISTNDDELARQVKRRVAGSKVVVLMDKIVQGGVGQRPACRQKWRGTRRTIIAIANATAPGGSVGGPSSRCNHAVGWIQASVTAARGSIASGQSSTYRQCDCQSWSGDDAPAIQRWLLVSRTMLRSAVFLVAILPSICCQRVASSLFQLSVCVASCLSGNPSTVLGRLHSLIRLFVNPRCWERLKPLSAVSFIVCVKLSIICTRFSTTTSD